MKTAWTEKCISPNAYFIGQNSFYLYFVKSFQSYFLLIYYIYIYIYTSDIYRGRPCYTYNIFKEIKILPD